MLYLIMIVFYFTVVVFFASYESFFKFVLRLFSFVLFFFFKQKTAYEMRISDWSSDVCSSDLFAGLTHTVGTMPLATEFRGDEQIGSARARLAYAFAHSSFVVIFFGGVDMSIAQADGRGDGRSSFGIVHGPGSQAKLWHLHAVGQGNRWGRRSEEHTSELQSLMRISYAVFCLKKKKKN